MKQISVIIPVYNTEKFLSQCLGSVVNQTYKNLEIIIIDDGTPDNSAQIYNDFAKTDARIKIIKQKNAGLSAARNTGIKNANGDYIHFIDSDDYLDLDYYQNMMDATKNHRPDIIAGGVISQNGKLYDIQYKNKCLLIGMHEKFKTTQALNNCTVWRYLFRRKFLQKNKLGFVTGRIFEDMLFTPTAIALANYIITVPDTYYHYVFNENSLLNKKYSASHEEQYKYAEQKLFDFIKEHNLENILNRNTYEQTIYKFLCFKPIRKTFDRINNISKYYLFGIRILKTQTKPM